MNLKDVIYNQINLVGNMNTMINESTEIIRQLMINPNGKELKFSKNYKDLTWGKFYIINYNFGKCKMLCPIFIIPHPQDKKLYNPEIFYAINIMYLPIKQRIEFFNLIFERFPSIIDFNDDKTNVSQEKQIKNVTFDFFYKILKSMGLQFSIRGYSITKIDKFFSISTKIVNRLIMMNINLMNITTMKQMYDSLDACILKDDLGNTLEEYAKILLDYKEDSLEFYKKLNLIEKYLNK
jgi:hypothetical protein